MRKNFRSYPDFVASWRLNYTLEHIIHISMLVTVFTVRVGEHNFNVIIII